MNNLIKYIKENYKTTHKESTITITINNSNISINLVTKLFKIEGFLNFNHSRIFNLKSDENKSALILILELLNKGYTKDEIYLEKTWKLGHNHSGSLDIALYKNNKPFHFIEVKDITTINNYIDLQNPTKTQQLFTYIYQEKDVKFGSYYTFDILNKKHLFYNIEITNTMHNAFSVDNLFDLWNKTWNKNNLLLNNNKFDYKLNPIKYKDLEKIDEHTIKIIFSQFLNILRQNSVSDKSNAFDKMINIFIVKVFDELRQDYKININGYTNNILHFQYLNKIDTDVSFLKRILNLYKKGMNEYMNKKIIDYNDDEIDEILQNSNNPKIRELIDNLRLKKNHPFSFIEVFDDKTFKENNIILIEVVKLLQNYKFKYDNKHQYLGDFFEELLNTSWKQESGQFFTPIPLVDFMVNSLPIETFINNKITKSKQDFIPKMIDYACGSGHFLVNYMDKIQNIINNTPHSNNNQINKTIKSYKINPFSWVKDCVVGIEKDYRLAKTTKISNLLNGDGDAKIIYGDGINKFSSVEYEKTILFNNDTTNEIFNYVIGNPPYSISGFMKNIRKNNIKDKDFELLKTLTNKASEIEVLFVERTWQLLKNGGITSIILPRSILTGNQYTELRKYILSKFKVLSIVELADNTFSGTTTSPIILFLKKETIKLPLNYEILLINSPKMEFENTKKEKAFLGYEFSSNKNKLGIKITNQNLKLNYSPIVKDFINGKNIKLIKYSYIKNINEIMVENKNKNMVFYTKNTNKENINEWINLKNMNVKINPKTTKNQEILEYLEIGGIIKNKVNIKNYKNIITKRICQKGDILFSLVNPNPEKVVLADKQYYISNAIIILRLKKGLNERVFEYLKNNKNNIFYDIKVFLDGFKITYGKINEFNLINNVYFKF